MDTRRSNGLLRVIDTVIRTPRMLRLTAAVDVAHLPFDPSCPNQVVRLAPPAHVIVGGMSGARLPSRTYTIRRYDEATQQLDIDVVLHGDGPFVRWARSAIPGDTVEFTGPRPHAVPSFKADALVMASDEAGLPAVASLLEAAPAELPSYVCIEIADATEQEPLPDRGNLHLRWLHRDGKTAGTTGALRRSLRDLDWPSGRVEVWAAGEATEVRTIRRFAATERGVARQDIHAYGYWRLGRSGPPE